MTNDKETGAELPIIDKETAMAMQVTRPARHYLPASP